MVAQIESTVAGDASPDRRAAHVYNKAVLGGFEFLKRTTRLDDLMAKAMALPDGRGHLVPVCDLHDGDDALIAKFADWREANSSAFPSRFPVTHAGTASWLRSKVLDVDDRLLFLLTDRRGYPIGHMGFANAVNDAMSLEVDNVVRGVPGAEPGLMGEAMTAMLDWAEEMFRPRSVYLRVLTDNQHAIEFYTRLGFRGDGLIPLRRHREGGGEVLRACEEGDVRLADAHFLRMTYAPDRTIDEAPALISTAGPSISAPRRATRSTRPGTAGTSSGRAT